MLLDIGIKIAECYGWKMFGIYTYFPLAFDLLDGVSVNLQRDETKIVISINTTYAMTYRN